MTLIGRRGFMKTATSAAIGAGLIQGRPGERISPVEAAEALPMPTRRLGKTEYQASLFSLGGQSTLEQGDKREESAEIIHRALDLGVNYIDTADSYGGGASEQNIGNALGDRRDDVFIATKTRIRTDEGIEDDAFERTCERLQTDYVNLYHAHGVHSSEDLDTFLNRENGGIRAFERLREKERIHHIGISSHSSATLMEAMRRYDLDCVFITMNPAGLMMNDPDNLRDMLAMAADKDVGVIGMKIVARGRIFERDLSIEEALTYALSLPIGTAALGITSVEQVEQNAAIAKTFEPYEEQTLAQLERMARA